MIHQMVLCFEVYVIWTEYDEEYNYKKYGIFSDDLTDAKDLNSFERRKKVKYGILISGVRRIVIKF